MKTTIASVFLLFFLFSTKSCLSSGNDIGFFPAWIVSALTDSDGDELLPGVPYYMVSANPGTGGGADLGWTENHRCPKFVMQHPSDQQKGTPVVLTPTDTRDCRIFSFTQLNISFVRRIDPLCRASTTWTVDHNSAGKAWINTGGGGFGGFFNVLPARPTVPNTYELGACYPEDDSSGDLTCDFVDRFEFEGFRRMGFEKYRSFGWIFKFVKVAPGISNVGEKQALLGFTL